MSSISDPPRIANPTSLPPATAAVAAYEANHAHRGFRIAELRTLFASVVDPDDWRNPWRVRIAAVDLPKLRAAADYFHAAPLTVEADHGATVVVACDGYQGWGEG